MSSEAMTVELAIDDEIEGLNVLIESSRQRIGNLKAAKAALNAKATPAEKAAPQQVSPQQASRRRNGGRVAPAQRKRIPISERVVQARAVLAERGEMDTNQVAEALGISRSYVREVMKQMFATGEAIETYSPERGRTSPAKYKLAS